MISYRPFIGVFIVFLYLFPTMVWSERLSNAVVAKLQSEIAMEGDAIEKRTKIARHYLEIGRADQTVSYLRPVAEKLHTGGMRLLATAYLKTNNSLQAIRVLQFLVSQNKSDYRSQTRLGEAYFAAQKFDKSIEHSNKAIKINARYRPAYELLTKSLEKKNKRYDLKETLGDMIRLFGASADLLSRICKLYYEDGFLAEAFKLCKKAITKNPNIADNHVFLALTYQATESKKRALAISKSTARRFPASEFAQFTAAKLSKENNDGNSAHRFYVQGTKANPKSFRNWLGRAKSAFETQNYRDALASFKRACLLDRSNTVQEFRSAAGSLKKINPNSVWTRKFNAAALKCRYKAS